MLRRAREWAREWAVTLMLRLRHPDVHGQLQEPFNPADFIEVGPPE